MKSSSLVFILSMLLSIVLTPLGARAEDIAIGHFGSLTGGTATFGISTKEGRKTDPRR